MSGRFGNFHSRLHPSWLQCKRYKETVAAPVQTMPSSWIVATCPLCGEKRRYLLTELLQGLLLSWRFEEWQRQSGPAYLDSLLDT